MILSGKKIAGEYLRSRLDIKPFDARQCGPNSYDVRLGNELHIVKPNCFLPSYGPSINTRLPSKTENVEMIDDYFVLLPGEFYLGHTIEEIHSEFYAPGLHGRSTSARHGVQVHLTAGFGDAGWRGQYVLELKNMTKYPILIFPGDRIAQIAFEAIDGDIDQYKSTYQGQRGVVPAKSLQDGENYGK